MRLLLVLAFFLLGRSLLADAVLMNNGERYIGEVTDLGTSLRIKNAAHPEGLEVKKSDVRTVYPKPEVMLQNLRDQVEKAKTRYAAGKKASDPNPDMKAAMDLLFDPEIEADEAIQIYPEFKAQFAQLQTSIQELRKMCRDGQVSGKAPVGGNEAPKPAPDPQTGQPPANDPKPAVPPPAVNPDEVFLSPPAESKPNDIEKAAKAMQARAAGHGFVGVTAKVVRRGDYQVVQMSCKEGMTPEMRKRLVWYADRLGQKFEIRAAHHMSAGESEQFPVPSLADVDSGKAKAPKGMKWYRTADGGPIVLLDKYVITLKDLGKYQVGDKGGVYYEMSNKSLAASLRADETLVDGNVTAGIWFVGDTAAWCQKNMCLVFEGAPGKRTWFDTNMTEPDWKVYLNILERPLPFRLTEAK